MRDNSPIRLPDLSQDNSGIFEIYIKKYIGLPEIEQKTLKNFISEKFIDYISKTDPHLKTSSHQP